MRQQSCGRIVSGHLTQDASWHVQIHRTAFLVCPAKHGHRGQPVIACHPARKDDEYRHAAPVATSRTSLHTGVHSEAGPKSLYSIARASKLLEAAGQSPRAAGELSALSDRAERCRGCAAVDGHTWKGSSPHLLACARKLGSRCPTHSGTS